jgi:hypothetical protein
MFDVHHPHMALANRGQEKLAKPSGKLSRKLDFHCFDGDGMFTFQYQHQHQHQQPSWNPGLWWGS